MKLLWQQTVQGWTVDTYLCIVEGDFWTVSYCLSCWENDFWGQHEIHKNQSHIRLSTLKLLILTMSNTTTSTSHLQFFRRVTDPRTLTPASGLGPSSEPRRRRSSRMSLPNNPKRSHTVETLRFKGNFTLHEPCVRSMWVCETAVRKETWYTTDSQIVCFTRSDIFLSFLLFFFFLFSFQKFAQKQKAMMFSERLDASFVLVGAALTFLPIEKANCSEVDACS